MFMSTYYIYILLFLKYLRKYVNMCATDGKFIFYISFSNVIASLKI